MTHRIGAKGQIVIPKRIRDRRGLAAGTPVSFEDRDDGVVVRPARPAVPLRGRFAGSGMAARLLEDRSRERDR